MKYAVVVMCLIIGLFCTSVYAAIPLITDDTGTLGKGKFQLDLAGEYAHDKEEGVTNKDSTFSAALAYGLADTIDVVLAVPYQSLRSDEADHKTRESGMSDLAIVTKWRFYEKDGLSLALKPGVSFPTGDDGKGLDARFGLYRVNFETLERIPTNAAAYYSYIIKNRQF